MVTNPADRSGKRPHAAWRARRVTAVVSGVAFVGLATGMAVEASTPSAHAATNTPVDPSPSDTQPTWAAPLAAPETVAPQIVPETVPQPVRHRAHTQTSGS